MSGEELTLVCSAQAEIHRQLKIEKVIEELEHSLEIEKSWLRWLLLRSVDELGLAGREVIELGQAAATLVEKLDDFDS